MSSSPRQQVVRDGITVNGWRFETLKGPIIADRDLDEYRRLLGGGVLTLPEMLFNQSRLTLMHEASGMLFDFNALDALKGWKEEALPPLQVSAAKEWRKSRELEIQQQQAVQLEYDWTYTTPYSVTLGRGSARPLPMVRAPSLDGSLSGSPVVHGSPMAATPAPWAQSLPRQQQQQQEKLPPALLATSTSPAAEENGGASSHVQVPCWQETTEQIDRSLLMERDPILFYDEVPLYESDLDDNGVVQLTAKVRVMPKCWFVLVRMWLRVDGSMVRLREARLFCRHDQPDKPVTVLREVKHCEGSFKELRAAGAPGEGPSYADADAAAAVFGAVAPIGLRKFELSRLEVA